MTGSPQNQPALTMGGNPQGNRLKGWRFLVTFFCYRKKVTRQQGETQCKQVENTKKLAQINIQRLNKKPPITAESKT